MDRGLAGGNGHQKGLRMPASPRRVVSLVPSITESLFDLGIGSKVVGITDYCVFPADEVAPLPRLGGPKDPRIGDVLALQPDLIIANREENSKSSIDEISQAGIPVWVTYPTSIRESMEMLWEMARIFQSETAATRILTLQQTIEWALGAKETQHLVPYFCPVWQDHLEDDTPWWMTFNQYTYASDVLSLVGGENVFSKRERRYPLEADLGLAAPERPGERDTHYPRVSAQDIVDANPQAILLPSEPYSFGPTDRDQICAQFSATPAVQAGNVRLVDGTLIMWFGTRLAKALEELPPFLWNE